MAGLLNPLPGHGVTQPFAGDFYLEPAGWLRPLGGQPWIAKTTWFKSATKRSHLHKGIDIGCPVGTPIKAPEKARVLAFGVDNFDGHFVLLGVRAGTVLEFNHLSKLIVPVGTIIEKGTAFALSGTTGLSTGPHVHYEVRHTGAVKPDWRESTSWAKYDPKRLTTGGDMAGVPWIISAH